jgi:GT2 family glycosyltransferase
MIYIVTPVFNRKDFTQDYLQALRNQTVQEFKIIIIDDGSTDGTAEMIENEFPEVILLKEKGDLWWAEATNVGIRYAMEDGATYIMTLNDDTIPSNNFIEKMIYWSNQEPKALLGAFAVSIENNKAVYGGEIRNWLTGERKFLLNQLSLEDQRGLHEVNIFPGRGLLIPIEVFHKIGLYDSKNLPQTFADYDFTSRAIKGGYKIYCNYDSILKIMSDESTGIRLKKKKTLSNYYYFLFDKRSGGNITSSTIFAFKNIQKPYLLPYLMRNWMSRLIGYWIK